MNIILLGAQGSGKGTQAEKISERLGIHHVSSGDLFRKASESNTEVGKKVKVHLDRGELVPDELTIAMVLDHITQPEFVRDGVLLDGFPRTIAQAQALDEGLTRTGQTIDCSVYLDVPRDVLLQRLSGRYICRAHQHVYNINTNPPKKPGVCDLDGSELYQRSDDKGSAVQKRLDTFFNETVLLLDYYRGQRKLRTANGNQSIDRVSEELVNAIKDCQ